MGSEVTKRIQQLGHAAEPYIIEQRRYFHQHPELSLQEFETTKAIARELDAIGHTPYARPTATGLIATLAGTAPDAYLPPMAARADACSSARISTRSPSRSARASRSPASMNGVMHACGHDCHIAMQLGSLRVLSQMRDALHGEVRAVFQPSEENGGGSALMINAGACEGVDGAYAAHIWSEVAAGTISCEPGPRMANTDWFRVDIRGTSCHGAMPQRGADASSPQQRSSTTCRPS